MLTRERLGLIVGPLVALATFLLPLPDAMSEAARRTGAVTLLMAVWWVTEAVPIAVTALIPVFLFPLLGILSTSDTCAAYGDKTNFFFFGGLVIASAVERWGLHRRIALIIMTRIGGSPRQVVLGFMTATALISMWASNTATTMMMLPIAVAVLEHFDRHAHATHAALAPALMLAIAYAASIGGVGTLVGTPPNVIFVGALKKLFPGAPPVGFGLWMLLGLPIVLVMIPLTWLYLTRVAFRIPPAAGAQHAALLRRELAELGPMRRPERRVLAVFATTAFLWIFRADLDFGSVVIPGWARLLPAPAAVDDTVIALTMATLLFLLPSGEVGTRLLGADWATRIPWSVIVLLGGGFALAAGVQASGLASWGAGHLANLEGTSPLLLVAIVALLTAVLSEFTLNSAVTALMMPILAAAAAGLALDPRLLMVPATLAASFTFMMPGGTAPNAMVFASGHLTVAQMARAGIGVKIVSLLVVTAIFFLIGVPGLGIVLREAPVWAR
jgi:solute carrier family 13 (sodium-dependent dicarboxylate transporter), member 2/3/5